MANGDPIVIGHPAKIVGGKEQIAIDSPRTPTKLEVQTDPNKALILVVKSGDGAEITLPVNKTNWVMEIREIPKPA